MLKPLVALSSMALGAAAVGVVVHMQRNQNSFAQEVVSFEPHRDISSARVSEVLLEPDPEPVSEPLTLEAVTIRGTTRARKARAPAAPPELSPCSEWRELGPNASVRYLCPDRP